MQIENKATCFVMKAGYTRFKVIREFLSLVSVSLFLDKCMRNLYVCIQRSENKRWST